MIHNIIPDSAFLADNVINVFTDASIQKILQPDKSVVWVGCPGAHIYIGDRWVNGSIKNIYDFTNNESELEAIFMGLQMAYELYNTSDNFIAINIFSDSQISIKGLTDWVFKWYRNTVDGVWHLNNNQYGPVSSQYIYMHIIDMILKQQISVRFYHIKSHYDRYLDGDEMKRDKYQYLIRFKKDFTTFNNLNDYTLDDGAAIFIIKSNGLIDHETRSSIKAATSYLYKFKSYPRPVSQPYKHEDMESYYNLISMKGDY